MKRSKRFLFSKFQWLVNATGWKIEKQNKHFSNIYYNQTTNPQRQSWRKRNAQGGKDLRNMRALSENN